VGRTNIVIAILVAAVVLIGGWLWRTIRHHAVRGTSVNVLKPADVAEALESCSRSLRTGSSLRHAIRSTALPVGPALAEGHSLPVVLDGWARLATDPSERMAATALALAAATGGPQAQAVDAAARAVRERISATEEVAAHSAQARLSATVIACLPVAFVAWTLLADHRTAATLLSTPIGWLCLAIGLGLDMIGMAWVRAIVRSAT
jgi:tight adherence protein B